LNSDEASDVLQQKPDDMKPDPNGDPKRIRSVAKRGRFRSIAYWSGMLLTREDAFAEPQNSRITPWLQDANGVKSMFVPRENAAPR
jgi:hypothetical protein